MPEPTEREMPMAVAQEFEKDWIKKDKAVEYVLENFYDEVKEAVFEQEAENKQS